MRRILAVLMMALLCAQTVYAMPERDVLVCTEKKNLDEDGAGDAAEQDAEKKETAEQGSMRSSMTGQDEAETSEQKAEQSEAEQSIAKETAEERPLKLSAESAILMEATTGKVLFEQEADVPRAPASVTKIMTLLLIFDAIDSGQIALEDTVTVSEYAASMGGSQVFLEPGETQTVDTMIKCISVASANDACVAMAELVAGSEEAFVEKMNERAEGLGMEHTHFVNCNGLDADGHETTARDIALMSRELIGRYPQIHDYCQIWMENITHTTSKGTSEFGLTNTNKLIRQYEYATGLKTGSTSQAKFCLSATGEKNGIQMIAVVMAEPDSKTRTKDAIAMLNYGFGKCTRYEDSTVLDSAVFAPVEKGVAEQVECEAADSFRYIDTEGSDLSAVEKEVKTVTVKAPVKAGDPVGTVTYRIGAKTLGEVPLVAKGSVAKATFATELLRALEALMPMC